ncbi:MAG: hypothetical protein V1802_01380 [Candidatus Aenigmatarchaeota archaeon]
MTVTVDSRDPADYLAEDLVTPTRQMSDEKHARERTNKIDESIEARVQTGIERIYRIDFFGGKKPDLKEANALVQPVADLIENYMKALTPFKGKKSWSHVERDISKIAQAAARHAGRDSVYYGNISHDVQYDDIRSRAQEAVFAATGWVARWLDRNIAAAKIANNMADRTKMYIDWEKIRDLDGFENNPTFYILQLYEKGLIPTYFGNIDMAEKFVVDIPLKDSGKKLLGCYAFGDREIEYVHKWEEPCTNLVHMKTRTVEHI